MESNTPVANHLTLRTVRVESGDDTYNLLDLWRVIWHRKWKIAAFVMVAILLSGAVVSVMKPVYRASSTMLIDERKPQAVTFQPQQLGDLSKSPFLQTQIELLRSRALTAQVVESLGLVDQPEFNPRAYSGLVRRVLLGAGLGRLLPSLNKEPPPSTEQRTLDQITQRVMEAITVEVQGRSSIVRVSVEMTDPTLAAATANALMEHYLNDQIKVASGASQSDSVWIRQRLAQLDEELKASEARLQAYRESEHLLDAQVVGSVSASELSLSTDRMIDARRARAEAESQYRQVEGLKAGGWESLVSVAAVMADPVVQQFKATQANARAKVDELSARYGARHPAMEAANSELSAATLSLKSQVEQVAAGIERNYQLAVANESALEASVNTNKAQVQDVSRKEFKLQALQREVDTNRQLYDTFLNRSKETAATADLTATNSRVLDEAMPPTVPVRPKKSLTVALVATLALLIACGLVLLRDSLRRIYKSTEEVESSLNLPVLGVLPLLRVDDRKHAARLFGAQKYPVFSEAIKSIRTALMLQSDSGAHRQIIVVTSSVPGEGKTTLSVNLAHALGQMERVLVIDADLRRSSFTDVFGFTTDTVGLSELLAGSAGASECIRHVDGIDVLCAGAATNNPLELLSSPRFAKALELLRGKYQRIIIDSPPTHAVTDALVLSRNADTMIYLIKSTTTVATAEKGIERLALFNAPVHGVVMNQIAVRQANLRDAGPSDYQAYKG